MHDLAGQIRVRYPHDLAGQIKELKSLRRSCAVTAVASLATCCLSCLYVYVVANAKLADAVNYLVFRYALVVLFAFFAIAGGVVTVIGTRYVIDACLILKRLRGAGR